MRYLLNRIILFCSLTTIGMFSAGCSSSVKTTTTTPTKPAVLDVSAERINSLKQWLASHAQEARALNVSGNVTVNQNGSSQSGSIDLKSKRLDGNTQMRIDSISLVISGPFGIKFARFMASPERYQMVDILHGEPVSGPTDAKSLQQLTQLNGVTLPMMSDLVYGLAPSSDVIASTDSLALYSNGDRQTLIIFRRGQNATEALDLIGNIPEHTALAHSAMRLARYQRWNGIINDPMNSGMKPAISLRYSDPKTINGVSIPQKISAVAGENSLSLEYTDIQINPSPLTVRIKMPQ